jgi:3-oxoacyl-[acyl-carrier protein] reductase
VTATAERPVHLVTGAGRGIGATIAGWLADGGADLVICSRTADELAVVAAGLRERFGADVVARVCDVVDPAAVAALLAEAMDRFGRVDVAVANAAILGPVGALVDVDLERWRHALDVNVVGTANVIRAVAGPMTAQGHGRILTIAGAGIGGPRPAARVSAYTTSKAAVVTLTETLAGELMPLGVTINAVAPGRVPTGFLRDVITAGEESAGAELFATAVDNRTPDLAPLRGLIEYLVSDRSSWLTGRLLSGRWDDPRRLERDRAIIEAGSRLRLRRIDEDLYREAVP